MHNNVLNLINTVTGNRGATWIGKTNGLYFFMVMLVVILWLEKAFKKITENINAKVAKCLE